MDDYAIVVFWSEEDGAWIADAPDLKYCSAHASSPEGAVAELRIAMAAWLEAARLGGRALPQALFKPHHEAAE